MLSQKKIKIILDDRNIHELKQHIKSAQAGHCLSLRKVHRQTKQTKEKTSEKGKRGTLINVQF